MPKPVRRKLGMIQKNKGEDVGGGIWVLFPLFYLFFKLDLRKAAQAQHQWTTSAWAEASYPLCSLLRYQLAWCVAQLLLESKQYCFFIFITALKSIGDSRLDEHEAFLQLPCRCRLANIHWTLMNRIKGATIVQSVWKNVREAYEFISAFTQTVASFTRRVRFLTVIKTQFNKFKSLLVFTHPLELVKIISQNIKLIFPLGNAPSDLMLASNFWGNDFP